MRVNILNNVKTIIDGVAHQFNAGEQQINDDLAELLISYGVAFSLEPDVKESKDKPIDDNHDLPDDDLDADLPEDGDDLDADSPEDGDEQNKSTASKAKGAKNSKKKIGDK